MSNREKEAFDLIKKADDIVGQELEVKILKNKSAAPFQKVELELIYGKVLII